MYDVDGNGVIDPEEMLKVVRAIYDMHAYERARKIFRRMDVNRDGQLTEEEFLRGCLEDDEMSKLLSPNIVDSF